MKCPKCDFKLKELKEKYKPCVICNYDANMEFKIEKRVKKC